MTPPIAVSPTGFLQAADTYKAVHTSLTAGIDALSGVLAGSGACAGSDNAGREWTTHYDPAAWDTINALGDLAMACGQMHDLLQVTGANHSNANSQSAPVPDGSALVFPPGSIPIYEPPEPPAMFGGSDAEPTGWDLVAAYVQGELWPNGHPDRLRSAASAWRAMATAIDGSGFMLPMARPLIESQQSPEVAAALTQHDIVRESFTALSDHCRALGDACDGYAAAIDNTKKQVIWALVELAGFIALDQAIGWAAAAFTVGGSAVAAQAAMAALLATYGARIAGIIRALRATVAATGNAGIAATSVAMTRAYEMMLPLLGSRPLLAGIGDVGTSGPGIFSTFAMELRRPHLRKDTVDSVLANTKVWGPKGKADDFYVVEADQRVKVPMNQSYDDKPWVTQLPKTEDGKYFLDRANGSLYPVNPKWEYGHLSGFEHRRLLAEAEQRGMSQAEFNDFVNSDPKRFAVEDLTGNRNHSREMK